MYNIRPPKKDRGLIHEVYSQSIDPDWIVFHRIQRLSYLEIKTNAGRRITACERNDYG